MDRAQQVEFCKKCEHRKPDIKQGLLCGLTDAKADFDDSCENFSEDNKAQVYYKQQEKGVRKETIASIIGTVLAVMLVAGRVYLKHWSHNQKHKIEYNLQEKNRLRQKSKKALSQNSSRYSIQQFVNEENDECPIRYDNACLTLTKVQMTSICVGKTGEYVDFTFVDDEKDEDGRYDVREVYDENYKSSWLKGTSKNADERYRKFYHECKVNKIGIIERYIGKRTKHECVLKVESYELP